MLLKGRKWRQGSPLDDYKTRTIVSEAASSLEIGIIGQEKAFRESRRSQCNDDLGF